MDEQNVQPSPVEKKEGKKSNGCLVGCLVVLGILVVLGVAGFFGVRALISSFKVSDLGSPYVAGEYKNAFERAGFETSDVTKLCAECDSLTFSQPHEVDVVVSGGEVASFLDASNASAKIGRFENSQVKFSNGKAELSTNFTYNGSKYPVYVSGNIERVSDNKISGEVFDVKAGSIPLPSNIGSMVAEALVTITNEKLASMGDNVRIDSVYFANDGVHFKGLVPGLAE